MKIGLWSYMHSHMNFLSRMSECCWKITRGRQGHEILVQTHEESTYALTYKLIRDTEYFIARLVLHKQTINSLSRLLKFREYLNLCNMYWVDLHKWMRFVKQKKKALEQLKSTGSCCWTLYLDNDQSNLNNNPKWSNQVKKKKSKHVEHIFHVILS